MTRRWSRTGFALLAALWVIVGLSAMTLTGLLVARDVSTAAENRIMLTRARWRAEECLERALAVVDDALSGRIPGGWEYLDRAVAAAPEVTRAACDVTFTPTGIAVDVNAADGDQLLALLEAIGIGEPRADSMVDALLDWRDGDDIPRPMGAERNWYREAGRFPPRNGPFADLRELKRVRGFEALPDSILGLVFTVEPGQIVWSRAPLAVLASLPGVGEETLARIAEARSTGAPLSTAAEIRAAVSADARAALGPRWMDLTRLTTDRPDAWIVAARSGGAVIEVRLAPAGARAAIVRRRTLP